MRGHIRKRGRRWALVIPLGRDPATGKPRQKWYSHKARREAEAHLAQIIAAMEGGGWTPPTKMVVGDFLEQWLRDYAAGAVGPVTMRNYRDIVRAHLTPGFGHVPLSTLSAQAIQGYMSRKLQDGLSPTSVQTHYRLLHEILGHAVKWGLLNRNPAAMAEPPRRRRYEPTVWDEEQVRLFLAEAKRSSRYHALYLTAILTGMRSGELAGLRWQDVDLARGVASIRQTLYRLDGRKKAGVAPQVLFKVPKTAASRRAIALPAAVVEALRAVRADQEENRRLLGTDYHDHGLVFCQTDGKPLHMHNVVRRDFRRVIGLQTLRQRLKKQGVAEEALPKGLPVIRFHDLRHLHASYLARAGVPAKVAQERLGHATPGFTMQVYTHTLAGQQEAAARAIERLVLGEERQEESKSV